MEAHSLTQRSDLFEAFYLASILHGPFHAECIYLFGSLAGGTPHSDIAAYDLLIITDREPDYGQESVRRLVEWKLPQVRRQIPHINPLICSRKFIAEHPSPVFFLAQTEGMVLYRDELYPDERPPALDYGMVYCGTARYYREFMKMAEGLLAAAETALVVNDARLAACHTAQASSMLLRVLWFVYHNFEAGNLNPEELYARVKTLSGELMINFDTNPSAPQNTLARLSSYLTEARDNPHFGVSVQTVCDDADSVRRMKEIVERVCKTRLEFYRQRR